jgi:hypothetical protein
MHAKFVQLCSVAFTRIEGLLRRSILPAIAILLAMNSGASAVPSFAEQTGQRCSMCHVGGLGPQLTPFGRLFKLGGYSLRSGTQFTMPLAGMIVASFLHTQKDQPSPPAAHFGVNDNFALDQASVFLAGGIGDHFGGFSQFTYNGVDRSFAWDQLDVRATTHETFLGSDVLIGVDVNNSPGVQDVWNTLPSWGFPYTSSTLAPSPNAAPLVAGGLAQRVLGSGVFAWWNSRLYTEASVYWTPGRRLMSALGVDLNDGDAILKGGAPYLRVAYQQDYGEQNFEIGAFGLFAHVYPGNIRDAGSNSITDLGVDASWQFAGNGDNFYQLNARYTHERQNLGASFLLDNAANPRNTLQELHLDGSYYWHNMIGVTVSPFDIWGSRDEILYGDNRTATPNSTGAVFQLDYTPWGTDISPLGPRFNVRIGMQYTVYTRFDGASRNYDGLGHNASDNDSFRLFTWFEF